MVRKKRSEINKDGNLGKEKAEGKAKWWTGVVLAYIVNLANAIHHHHHLTELGAWNRNWAMVNMEGPFGSVNLEGWRLKAKEDLTLLLRRKADTTGDLNATAGSGFALRLLLWQGHFDIVNLEGWRLKEKEECDQLPSTEIIGGLKVEDSMVELRVLVVEMRDSVAEKIRPLSIHATY